MVALLLGIGSFFFALPQVSQAQNIGSLRGVVTTGFSFKKDLLLGDTDPDVKELQKVLNSDVDTTIALTGVGSRGQETTYFGSGTKAAVIKFQEKYREAILTPNGLTKGTGSVGKATRTKLNLLIGVMNTSDSVGLPQSRAAVTTYVAPTTVAQPADNGISICSFVNLLLNIGVIAPEKANMALSAVNCPGAVANSANRPSVDLKANGSDGPVSVNSGSSVSLSWTSINTSACSDGANNLQIAGDVNFSPVTASRVFSITCRGVDGTTVNDSVTVNVDGATPAPAVNNLGPKILNSQLIPGYSKLMIKVTTDKLAKLVVSYGTTMDMTYRAAYEDLQVVRQQIIPNLSPDTLYYIQLNMVDADGNGTLSNIFSGKTSNDPTYDDFSDVASSTNESGADIAQRVLFSSDGNGVVSLTGTDSLKTNSKITVEAWVKPTSWRTSNGMSGTKDSVIISKGNVGKNIDYALSLDNGKLVYSNNDASVWTCSSTVPLNKWTHVAVVADELAQKLSLYVNGVKYDYNTTIGSSTASTTNATALCSGPRGVFNKKTSISKLSSITNEVGTLYSQATSSGSSLFGGSTSGSAQSIVDSILGLSSGTSGSTNPTSNVYLGNMYPRYCGSVTADSNGFIGSLDDIKMWNTARTDAQIKTDMKSSAKGATGLIGYYTFDDGTVSDISINSNNGTMRGSFSVIDDSTATSTIVAADYTSSGYDVVEPCEEYPVPPPEPDEPDYGVQFAGQIMKVNKCSNGRYQVLIQACSGQKAVSMLKPNPEATAIEARDAAYYNTDKGFLMVTSLAKVEDKTMVFAGVANGAWDEVCTTADQEAGKPSQDIRVAPGALQLSSFTYGNTEVKSAGRVESWSLRTRGVGTCISTAKHRNMWQSWF